MAITRTNPRIDMMYGCMVHSKDPINLNVILDCNGWKQPIPEHLFRNMMCDQHVMQHVCSELRERSDLEEKKCYQNIVMMNSANAGAYASAVNQHANKKLLLLLP